MQWPTTWVVPKVDDDVLLAGRLLGPEALRQLGLLATIVLAAQVDAESRSL